MSILSSQNYLTRLAIWKEEKAGIESPIYYLAWDDSWTSGLILVFCVRCYSNITAVLHPFSRDLPASFFLPFQARSIYCVSMPPLCPLLNNHALSSIFLDCNRNLLFKRDAKHLALMKQKSNMVAPKKQQHDIGNLKEASLGLQRR